MAVVLVKEIIESALTIDNSPMLYAEVRLCLIRCRYIGEDREVHPIICFAQYDKSSRVRGGRRVVSNVM